ncbi:MAG: selenide, water dikinase [Miltoncostaeaceae bacterium]|nr:selenide, water dikinase [Miltoncostaeaceae bacterium]
MSEAQPTLTAMAHGAGCGCKLGQGLLLQALAAMPPLPVDPNILVGHQRLDDAAVYRVSDDLAVVASLDFFTPIVDDPATFGAIAATNALSDLYAMGARPTFALAVAAYPKDGDISVLGEIFRGGAEAAQAQGCPVLGGHTIDDAEPKYGLSVVGTAHPDRLMTNAAGRPGDVLVLTKPLGTGVAATAARAGAAPPVLLDAAIASMLASNGPAAEAALEAGVRCATDVTGFGLLGHLREMVVASGVGAVIRVDRVPVFDEVLRVASGGHVPGGTERNRDFAGPSVDFDEKVSDDARTLMFDPQTSGGLLLAVPPEQLQALGQALGERGIRSAAIGKLIAEPVGRIGVITPVGRLGATGGGSRTARPPAPPEP